MCMCIICFMIHDDPRSRSTRRGGGVLVLVVMWLFVSVSCHEKVGRDVPSRCRRR